MKLREVLETITQVQEKIQVPPVLITGGCVRDKYMNLLNNISDIDLTNGNKNIQFLSDSVFAELKKKYNCTKKEMPDGHSTIFLGNLKMDFSSNFNVNNIKTILKHINVNPTDINCETFSRDFTCNSLLMSLNLKDIQDPTKHGFSDIKNKLIKTCLSPEITLTSNRNRVVRSIYLACKLGFDIDSSIIEYVKKNPNSIKISTPKSIAEKLNEAFKRDGDKASFLLSKMGLWKFVPILDIMQPYYKKALING